MFPIELIEEGSSALPDKGGDLPDLVLRKRLDDRFATDLVGGGQQQFQIAFATDELVLFRGATLENPHEVLDALLTGGDGFGDAHLVWDVSDDREILLVGLG